VEPRLSTQKTAQAEQLHVVFTPVMFALTVLRAGEHLTAQRRSIQELTGTSRCSLRSTATT
jgi:hypothetical protein